MRLQFCYAWSVQKQTHRWNAHSRGIALIGVGVLIGLLISTVLRFVTIQDASTHYHANFALYINGERQLFDSFAYYEEVAACSAHDASNPKIRTHMHDNNPGLVHVHAEGVTWGHFFANLGYGLGRNSIETENEVFVDGRDGRTLSFILNGQEVNSPMNQVIQSEDKLLISYGNEPFSELEARLAAIPSDAAEANTRQDPSACAGTHSSSFGSRLKQAIGLPASEH